MKCKYFYRFGLGHLYIVEESGSIVGIHFSKCFDNVELKETPLIKKTFEEIEEYMTGKRQKFDVPFKITGGTEFMNRVWNEVAQIPYGEVITYKELATRCGNDKASRIIGSSLNRNPLPLLIPCHRVIGTNGSLVGYKGGLKLKEKILKIEKEHVSTTIKNA